MFTYEFSGYGTGVANILPAERQLIHCASCTVDGPLGLV